MVGAPGRGTSRRASRACPARRPRAARAQGRWLAPVAQPRPRDRRAAATRTPAPGEGGGGGGDIRGGGWTQVEVGGGGAAWGCGYVMLWSGCACADHQNQPRCRKAAGMTLAALARETSLVSPLPGEMQRRAQSAQCSAERRNAGAQQDRESAERRPWVEAAVGLRRQNPSVPTRRISRVVEAAPRCVETSRSGPWGGRWLRTAAASAELRAPSTAGLCPFTAWPTALSRLRGTTPYWAADTPLMDAQLPRYSCTTTV